MRPNLKGRRGAWQQPFSSWLPPTRFEHPKVVIAGLVPAIHGLVRAFSARYGQQKGRPRRFFSVSGALRISGSDATPIASLRRDGETAAMTIPVIGVIGGSGLYQIDGLADVSWRRVETPFGSPSDELCFGRLGGTQIVFLPRHGRGHPIPPSEINFRANIDALKRAGVTDLVSLSAVGSLKPELPPGSFVLIDQFIDRTFARAKSFFGTGRVAHVSMGHPVCARLGDRLATAAESAGIAMVRGGTYLVMEGPQFSTMAESNLYRNWGCDVIGMTNMPEAKLAREAELCYATIAMVTDFDCWHPDHDHVTVEQIVSVLLANAEKAKGLVVQAVPRIAADRDCPHGCRTVLDHALITAPDSRDAALVAKLDAVAGRVLKRANPT
jgi:5'-methylthioadenosine phosphorylase